MDPALRAWFQSQGLTPAARTPARAPRPWRPKPLGELVPGELVHTAYGSFFLARQVYGPDYRHGTRALTELLAYPGTAGAALARDPRLAGLDLSRLAFLDVETTGLAGGTGTICFLIGIGCFENDSFTLYQFFLHDLNEEAAQLAAVGELLSRLGGVVSFNGKSFDLPLLETRFVRARQRPQLVDAPHLDLLAPSRRIWKHRLDSCALSSLESAVLGIERGDTDLPGYMIPDIYLDYIHTGDATELARVFGHNAQDILSLVSLACQLFALLGSDAPLPGEDAYGLAGLLLDLGHADRAESLYVRATQSCRSPTIRELAMRDLAYLLKRDERRAEALAWWQKLAAAGAVYACEELAKYYEWRDADLPQAAHWTLQGIALAERWPPDLRRRDTLAALRHRLSRLAAKLEGSAGD